ncbi:MAG: hypothetical protein IPM02_28085 [Betaproteobacteria bacterium]|nr:hypothetical protein [Betaproteobacteria bacterium]
MLQTRIQKTSTGLKLVATHSDGTNPFITQVTSTIAIPTDAWVNLVTVHQGTTVTLYINGQLAGALRPAVRWAGAPTAWTSSATAGNYTGLLDDLRLGTRPLRRPRCSRSRCSRAAGGTQG